MSLAQRREMKLNTTPARKFTETPAQRLRIAYLCLHRTVDACFKKRGVTADQFVLLRTLWEEEGINQKDLSNRLSSDPNTVTSMIKLLDRRKLIRRKVPKHDLRMRHVYLTKKGHRMLSTLLSDAATLSQAMDQFLPRDRMEKFLEALDRIPIVMEEAAKATLRRQD